jgi:hypothetical protein
MELRMHTHLTMISRHVAAVRKAVEAGHADVDFGCRVVIYARREARLVAEGRRDGEVSVGIVAGLARAVVRAAPQPEDRGAPRPPEPAPVEVRREDCVAREPGGPWRHLGDSP